MQHADDDHDPHEKRREQRDLCRSAAVDPGQREQGVDECRRERAERVKHHAVAGEPEHQPRRIGDRAELHHHEGHGEHDRRQRHHPGRRSRKQRLGGGHGESDGVAREVSLLDSRQREPTEHSPAHIEHRNEPGLHRRPTRLSPLRSSPSSRATLAVYGIDDAKTQGSSLRRTPPCRPLQAGSKMIKLDRLLGRPEHAPQGLRA